MTVATEPLIVSEAPPLDDCASEEESPVPVSSEVVEFGITESELAPDDCAVEVEVAGGTPLEEDGPLPSGLVASETLRTLNPEVWLSVGCA